jgi:phage baseplate assembly protein W
MPVERVSKGFKDVSSSFQISPLSNDLLTISNETAIARSVRNLLLTNKGKRPFNPILGSNVSLLLFETVDMITASAIRDEIETTINNFEPRVNLLEVMVSPDYDSYEFNVTVRYEIVGIDVLPQQLSFALQPTR